MFLSSLRFGHFVLRKMPKCAICRKTQVFCEVKYDTTVYDGESGEDEGESYDGSYHSDEERPIRDIIVKFELTCKECFNLQKPIPADIRTSFIDRQLGDVHKEFLGELSDKLDAQKKYDEHKMKVGKELEEYKRGLQEGLKQAKESFFKKQKS